MGGVKLPMPSPVVSNPTTIKHHLFMRTFYSLKTFFIMCIFCMVGTLCAWAQTTVTFTASADKSSTTSITKDGVTIQIGSGSLGNGSEYRFYKSQDVTISCSEGNITKIVFTCTANGTVQYGPGCFKNASGEYSYSNKIGTWTGDAASVKFTSSTSQVRATEVEVTYTAGSNVSAPKLSQSTQTFSNPFDVALTADEGATIYYTLDGSDPTSSSTKYEGTAIHISNTTTLKAIAIKDGESSNVTTATYTFVVATPTISVQSKIFNTPFDVTLSAEEGATIFYTLDGSDPTSSSTKYVGTAISITETITLKAIAIKNGTSSEIATATYTYNASLVHEGTFASPLTPEELIANGTFFTGKDVWVKGMVLGTANSAGDGYNPTAPTGSSIAIGESGQDKCIAVQLTSPTIERTYCNNHATELMGKDILFYGNATNYFGRIGLKKIKAFARPDDESIATLSVKTDEGYATFVSEYAFYVPEGVECGTITDANDGKLTINYKYKAGSNSEIVPANYPVLVKADGQKTFNLAITSENGSSADTNLLKAGTGSEIEAEADHTYYKLAYNNFDTHDGLGFYWGAEDGGAFTVPAGNAYLDVPSTSTTSVMSFRFEDAVTGIAPSVVNAPTEKVAYTIDGRRVDASHLTKGLYIVNGKKVLVK